MAEPLELEDLYPVLRHPAWEGTADAVCFPLAEGLPPAGQPVVALAFLSAGELRFLSTHDEAQHGFTRAQAIQLALEHIAARPATWYPSLLDDGPPEAHLPGTPSRVPLLAWEGDTLAAEKLLDPAFMKLAHEQLGTRRVAVGVPCRGLLLAVDGNRPVTDLDAFARRVAWHYLHDKRRAITHQVLFHDRRLLRGAAVTGVYADSDAALDAVRASRPLEGAPASDALHAGAGPGADAFAASGSVLLQLRRTRRIEDPRGHTLVVQLTATSWPGVRAFTEAFAVATFESAAAPEHRPRVLRFEVDASLLPADDEGYAAALELRRDLEQLLYRLRAEAGGQGPATSCHVGFYDPAEVPAG